MISSATSIEATRELLLANLADIEASALLVEPTLDEIAAFGTTLDDQKAITHKTNRGKREVAEDLNINVSDLEAMFVGKSVLDIGCGEGVFSQEIARLKRTRVTAVDYDPVVLSRVPKLKNLRSVEGSGYDLQSAIGDEEFDIVVSAYSSLLWARSPHEKLLGLTGALQSTRVGGTTLFVPISQHIEHRKLDRAANAQGIVRGFPHASEQDVQRLTSAMKVADWSEALMMNALLRMEKEGAVNLSFVPSRNNAKRIPIHPLFNGINDPRQEAYSAIVTIQGR